ncbi:vomeronasal type-1 receptor 1 [Herpailurus yagouaroundi]|uniref:vomeronasal type-1 receptor 1 n=1 Tax=Herpailurus yagouaroundi TaxID=1608482 RepID=UPI001AD72F72|nr:vomeronasal type-1 receptor 1-like [Puma yagouaroundi]
MAATKWEIGILFLTQLGVGILANASLLCLYNFTLLTGHKVRPTDLILNQLVLANSLVLLLRGIPQTMAAFRSKYFLNETGCKLLFYFHRVARGVSLSTTTLLGVFQTIKLCSNFSRWLELRIRSPMFIGFCCLLCWILHLLVNIFVPIKMISPMSGKNFSVRVSYVYCSSLNPDRFLQFVVVAIFFITDFVCLSLMAWASGSVVLFLLRHKQRVQHIHSHSFAPRPSPEARATCTILILVSAFFFFYSLSSLLFVWMTLFAIPGQWLVDASMFLSSCFPTFSPFVLIFSDTRISRGLQGAPARVPGAAQAASCPEGAPKDSRELRGPPGRAPPELSGSRLRVSAADPRGEGPSHFGPHTWPVCAEAKSRSLRATRGRRPVGWGPASSRPLSAERTVHFA